MNMPVLDLRTLATGCPRRRTRRRARARRQHPDDLDVAAERDRLDAVLGLAHLLATRRVRPKPTKYWVTFPPNFLAGIMWPSSCRPIEARIATTKSEHAERCSSSAVMRAVSPRLGDQLGSASARAQASAARTSSTVSVARPRGYVVRGQARAATVGTISTNGSRPGAERLDADLVGGVVDRGRGAAPPPGLAGQRDRGERLVVEREELPRLRPGPVDRGRGVGHPVGPGQAERDRDQHRRRAGLDEGRAVDELDHRVHDARRVHDDLDAVERDAEEQVRLDHLEPLVDQGRGVDRDRPGPCPRSGGPAPARASRRRARSRVRPRNGPPLAVSTRRRTSSGVPPRRHCASALCSQSTGTIWPGLARPSTSGPPMISDSLLASASVLPASSAASVGPQPDGAGDAVEHDVARSAPPASVEASSPSRGVRRRELRDLRLEQLAGCCPPAVRPTTRNRSGLARTRSSAWVPIDPVDPRMTTSRCAMRAMLPGRGPSSGRVEGRE